MKIEMIEIDGKEFKVIIGQNSNENDIIISLSEPDDIWFHFQNISGPHIILQTGASHFNFIPKEILNNVGNKLFLYKKTADKTEKIMYTEIKNIKKTKVKGTVDVSKYKIL